MPTAPCRTLSASASSAVLRRGVGQPVGVGRTGTDQRDSSSTPPAARPCEHPGRAAVDLVGCHGARMRVKPATWSAGIHGTSSCGTSAATTASRSTSPGSRAGETPRPTRPPPTAGSADRPPQAEGSSAAADVVGGVAHGRPPAPPAPGRCRRTGPRRPPRGYVASHRLPRVGVKQPGPRRGVAQHHRAGVLRAARQHVHRDGAAVTVGRRLLRGVERDPPGASSLRPVTDSG